MIKKIIALLCVTLILSGCGGGSSDSGYSPPVPPPVAVAFDILGFLFTHPIIKVLSFLKIVGDITSLANASTTRHDDSSKTVSFETSSGYTGQISTDTEQDNIAFTTSSGSQVNFAPAAFQASYQLISDEQVNNLDNKMQEDYRQCTDALLDATNIDHENLIQELEFRINCLTEKGYSENDRAYMQIKHNLSAYTI